MEKNKSQITVTILILFFCGMSITISLAFFNSLYLTFVIYYLFCGICIPLIDVLAVQKKGWKGFIDYIGIRPAEKRGAILVGLGAGIFVFLFIFFFFYILRDFILADNGILSAVESWGVSSQNIVIIFIVMLVFNGAIEELFFRGYIHKRLEGMKNRVLALAIPSLFFTAQHTFIIRNFMTKPGPFALLMLGIGIGGVFWAITREYFKTVIPAVICHVLATAGYMSAFYWFLLK